MPALKEIFSKPFIKGGLHGDYTINEKDKENKKAEEDIDKGNEKRPENTKGNT